MLVQFEHSAIRCGEVVLYHKRNNFCSTYRFAVDNAYHTALCTTNDATKAHMEAVQTLCEIKFIDIIAGKMAVIAEMNGNDDG